MSGREPFDGALLEEHLKKIVEERRISKETFYQETGIQKSLFRECVTKNMITPRFLDVVCRAMGTRPSEYWPEGRKARNVAISQLIGLWVRVFLQMDGDGGLHVKKYKADISSDGRELSGVFFSGYPDSETPSASGTRFVWKGEFHGRSVVGTFRADDRLDPVLAGVGSGTLLMSLSKKGWLEGITSFVSPDGTIAGSHSIWVKDDQSIERVLENAVQRLRREEKVFEIQL
ncbi:helix-turn-helix transcriptional regulator [Ruegeria conchae]|uniref:helix-turn-helix domain-containing protein n=1 Tax=Ruegeria conchae TaxID=981384 RepID=UPI0029C80DE5|nr:helix-turn-helix transcriptional regulator [Ruegeria conchae]